MGFEMKINNSGSAFRDLDTGAMDTNNTEIRRILQKLAQTLMSTAKTEGSVLDINGNVVGEWTITDDNVRTSRSVLDRIFSARGVFRVTDPSFRPEAWCAGDVMAKPGWYVPFVDCYCDRRGGHKVARMAIVHEDVPGGKDLSVWDFDVRSPITAGVDSGTCAIIDMDYFEEIHADDERWDLWFNETVARLAGRQGRGPAAGVDDRAALISASGNGDGGYPCWLHWDEHGVVDGILVEFLSEDDMDELDNREE